MHPRGVGARAPCFLHLRRSRCGDAPHAATGSDAATAVATRTAARASPEDWWLRKRAELASLTASRGAAEAPPATQPQLPAASAAAPQQWWPQKRAELASTTARGRAGDQRAHETAGSLGSSGGSAADPPSLPTPAASISASSTPAWPAGRLGPASPELAVALAPLAAACSADHAALTRAVACLPPGPLQQGVVQHGCAVARHLCNLGCAPGQLAALLSRCLLLFASPPEQRAAPLLAQLVTAGLTAPEAARCLERSPAAAGAGSFEPMLAALAGLLGAGAGSSSGGVASGSSDASSMPAAARRMQGSRQPRLHLAGDLLRAQPEAAQLLRLSPAELQRRAAHLQSLGLSAAELAAALSSDGGAALLALSAVELDERAEVLREELGVGPAFFAALLRAAPAAVLAECDAAEVLEPHAAALAEAFGRDAAREMVAATPALLAVPVASWQRSLAVLALCWVDDPAALVQRLPRLLCADLAAPASVATRVVLQRGLALSAAAVYARLAGCVAGSPTPPANLAARLDFLQQLGSGASDGYESGSSSDNAAAAGRLSMHDVCSLSDAQFASHLGLATHSWLDWQAAFEQSVVWQHLLHEAAAEAARVRALLAAAAAQPSS